MKNYRVAVVTGASSGFGAAIAERFAREGLSCVLMARRKDRLTRLTKKLAPHADCHVAACDIRDLEAVRKAISGLPKKFSAVDVLVNNAGLALGLEPAQRASWAEWQQMIETNCMALAFLTHCLLPGMVERNCGHIVNIGSVAGSYAYPGSNVYGASKAFVEQFTRNLKADLLGTAVRVTNVEPGMTSGSEFSLVRFSGDKEKAASVYQGVEPLKPADIAECVYWAVSQPANVNINRIEVMPVCQAPSRTAIHRKGG
ncbi:MAG: NADP-dependent 3-hydroxy acid dehydrogenase YdfG [Syntrophaceae bacterium PtaU1.Bin231]|nr:MAG: NADP-dependent 3-hydroxy acid dehydrogenase YdfG [Syntrophaceae bacterium PtaU1.Bin231]HOG18114.1 SDR family NAD(P)-dependent oxidoreductase [Syntrophales bacterium]